VSPSHVVAHPQPPESFYGAWHVHGGEIQLRRDGTGGSYAHEGFTPDGRWVNVVQTLSTRLSANKKTLTITMITQHWEADGKRTPNPAPQDPLWIVPGDTFTATFVHPHLMKVTALQAHNAKESLGNPYLCGQGLASKYQGLCGA